MFTVGGSHGYNKKEKLVISFKVGLDYFKSSQITTQDENRYILMKKNGLILVNLTNKGMRAVLVSHKVQKKIKSFMGHS